MLKYEDKQGMSKCLFLDDETSCDNCDMRIRGICKEGFYKKYMRFKNEISGESEDK